jgi:NAD(P)-dependent dehydrogenase (short-subunit alcohol dehydrogenase family)
MNANEVALVTGGNKGIGRAIVHRLAHQGFTVYLGARSPERGHSAVEELKKEGGPDIRFVHLDVTDSESVASAVDTIESETGRLDVLVNNAGIMVEWGVEAADVTAAQLREVYEVNVFGVVTVTSACVPLLRRSGNARIVNMSSGLGSLTMLSDPAGPFSTRAFLAYSSSKAALNALTLLYANALRADGIKVNAVSPGMVPTRTPPRPSPAATAPPPTAPSSRPSSRPSPPTAPPEFSAAPIPWTKKSPGNRQVNRS